MSGTRRERKNRRKTKRKRTSFERSQSSCALPPVLLNSHGWRRFRHSGLQLRVVCLWTERPSTDFARLGSGFRQSFLAFPFRLSPFQVYIFTRRVSPRRKKCLTDEAPSMKLTA